jgi:cell division protein FtsZ
MLIEYDGLEEQRARIKVIGVGGAGGNAIRRMIEANVTDVEFIAVNTDAQALLNNPAEIKIQIGANLTRGLGAGANAKIGYQAAVESKDRLEEIVRNTDMVFITAGMGGGTGTGAAPVIAEIAKNSGALTIGFVTKPFLFEGTPRMKRAEAGIERLREHVDSLIIVPNQKLIEFVDDDTNIVDAFNQADLILNQGTAGISDLITKPGLINLDFADVKTVINRKGPAVIGVSRYSGTDRAIRAVENAIHSPLLESNSIKGASGLLINFTGGKDMRLQEVNKAASIIQKEAGEDANIIVGAMIDENIKDEIRVTVIATGFNGTPRNDSEDELPESLIPKTSPTIQTAADPMSGEEQIPIFRPAPQPQTQGDIPVFGENHVPDETLYPLDNAQKNDINIPTYLRLFRRNK